MQHEKQVMEGWARETTVEVGEEVGSSASFLHKLTGYTDGFDMDMEERVQSTKFQLYTESPEGDREDCEGSVQS